MQADYEAEGKDMWGGARILLLPTVIINTNQYRGRLDTPSILRALCAGFSESTEPEVRVQLSNPTCAAEGLGQWDVWRESCSPRLQVCLAGALQTDECAAGTHDCWNGDSRACTDTFRGYTCQCPAGKWHMLSCSSACQSALATTISSVPAAQCPHRMCSASLASCDSFIECRVSAKGFCGMLRDGRPHVCWMVLQATPETATPAMTLTSALTAPRCATRSASTKTAASAATATKATSW